MYRTLLSILGIAILSACTTVGPNYQIPATPLQANFSQPGGDSQLASKWWKTFADPQLDLLVATALANSPDLATARAKMIEARLNEQVVASNSSPKLGLSSGYSRDKISQNSEMLANLPFKNVQTLFNNSQLSFDASWEIDLFGYHARQNEAARAQSEAAVARNAASRISLSAEVVRNYLAFRLAQQQEQNAHEQLLAQETLLKIRQASVNAGNEDQLALSNNRAALAAIASLPPQYASDTIAALGTLAILTGEQITTLQTQLSDSSPLPAVPEPPASGLPASLLTNRPDIIAAERDLASASANIGVAVAAQYPRISLIGKFGWVSVNAGTLFDATSQTWNIGPQLYLPLFNGRQLQNQKKASEAAYNAMLGAYRKQVLTALADVESALGRLTSLEQIRQNQEALLGEKLRQYQLNQTRADAGDISRQELLSSRLQWIQQQNAQKAAQAHSLIQYVALCKALGDPPNR